MVDQSSPVTDVQQAVPVAQSPASIWLSPACEITAHDGRTWANPAPAIACDECGDPWIEYVRADLALPCKSGEGAGEIGDFVMVPRKLTDDMLEAVVKLDFTSTHDPLWPEYWAAMLDAAPTVPDATQTREAELVAALSGLELTEDGYSLRVAYDGDAADDGRAIVVGGETVVTFADSDEGEAVREAIFKIMGKSA